MKAIETTYRGTKFRSRAEARWAVLFDFLGVEWRYEYEGYELPSGRYVPDFWLPKIAGGSFLEVKGAYPTAEEMQLCIELGKQEDRFVFMAWGEMGVWTNRDYFNSADSERGGCFEPFTLHSMFLSRCGKRDCGRIDIVFRGHAELVCSKHWTEEEPKTLHNTQKMMAAYEAAYAYRFWDPHGAKP